MIPFGLRGQTFQPPSEFCIPLSRLHCSQSGFTNGLVYSVLSGRQQQLRDRDEAVEDASVHRRSTLKCDAFSAVEEARRSPR
jgi:hypothetical protein